MSDWEQTIGRKIRDIRLRTAMSQERLAELSGMTNGYISQIETGRRVPSAKAISRISEALGADMADLMVRDRELPSEREALVQRVVDMLSDRSVSDIRFAHRVLSDIFDHFDKSFSP